MEVEIKPTEKTGTLLEYLKPRFKDVEKKEEGKITVKTEKPEKLARIPGIEKYRVEGEQKDGIGGKPIHRKAFLEIKNREDAVKALLATVEGYTLYISTEREWDLRALKKYNSEIVEAEKPVAEELGIEELDEEFDIDNNKQNAIYREFLTEI